MQESVKIGQKIFMEHVRKHRPADRRQLVRIIRLSVLQNISRMPVLNNILDIPKPVIRVYVGHVVLAALVLKK